MAHMERCSHCGVIHYPGKHIAVYIGGKYYCKPSCANAHREKETKDATPAFGPCDPAVRKYE